MDLPEPTDPSPSTVIAAAAAAPPPMLHYATPARERPPGGRWGAAAGVTLIALFVCAASIALFLVVAQTRNDFWPAALAVAALAGMGTACALFLTRR